MKSFIGVFAISVFLTSYAQAGAVDYIKSCGNADGTQRVEQRVLNFSRSGSVNVLGLTYKIDDVLIQETDVRILQEPNDQVDQEIYSAYQKISRKDGGQIIVNTFSAGDFVVCRLVKRPHSL